MNPWARVAAHAVMAALLVSCGDDDDDNPTGPDPAENDLVFMRDDQSQIQFSSDAQLFVWCGAWEEGEVDTPSVQIFFGGPTAADPFWVLQAVIADVALGEPLSFPNDFVFDEPKDAAIFLYDHPNELSTQDDQSSGTITFQQLDCGTGGEVQFEIDAVIGSELIDDSPVSVTGTFRAPIGAAPPR